MTPCSIGMEAGTLKTTDGLFVAKLYKQDITRATGGDNGNQSSDK